MKRKWSQQVLNQVSQISVEIYFFTDSYAKDTNASVRPYQSANWETLFKNELLNILQRQHHLCRSSPFLAIFRNEITTILTPLTSERDEWGRWEWSRFSFWRTLITNPQMNYSKPHKKCYLIFVIRRPLPFKRDLAPRNRFLPFSLKIKFFFVFFWKNC